MLGRKTGRFCVGNRSFYRLVYPSIFPPLNQSIHQQPIRSFAKHSLRKHKPEIDRALARMSSDSILPDFPVKRRWFPLSTTDPSLDESTNQSKPFTVLTYNILAQCLVRRDHMKYCTNRALKVSHRRIQLVIELLSLEPDAFCLQECDYDLYDSYLRSLFDNHGFNSHWLGKDTDHVVKHGCAIFYRRETFEQVSYQQIQFNEIADHFQSMDMIRDAQYNELRRDNVAQVLTLKFKTNSQSTNQSNQSDSPVSDSDSGIIITNMHCFWDPRYRFVRLAQVHRLLVTLHATMKQYPRFKPIICGDFNINPSTLIYQYITKRSVEEQMWHKFCTPPHHGISDERLLLGSTPQDEKYNPDEVASIDWERPCHSVRRDAIQYVMKNRMEIPELHSIYSDYTSVMPADIADSVIQSQSQPWCDWKNEPPFTHYLDRWKGTLDYLFVLPPNQSFTESGIDNSLNLVPLSILELPTEELLIVTTALPNEIFSSDHLCVGAKFVMKTNK